MPGLDDWWPTCPVVNDGSTSVPFQQCRSDEQHPLLVLKREFSSPHCHVFNPLEWSRPGLQDSIRTLTSVPKISKRYNYRIGGKCTDALFFRAAALQVAFEVAIEIKDRNTKWHH
jgi:hypothetical protein